MNKRMNIAPISISDSDTIGGKSAGPIFHRLDIAPRRKMLARTREDHTTHIVIRINLSTNCSSGLAVALPTQRITGVGPVDSERRHGIANFKLQKVHKISLSKFLCIHPARRLREGPHPLHSS